MIKNTLRILSFMAVCTSLCGCTSLHNNIQTASAGSVGAEPISIRDINDTKTKLSDFVPSIAGNTSPDIEFIGLAIGDSEDKCTTFKRELSFGERGIDTVGDLTVGLLSGLGAVFTPAATVRVLSAGAAIVTGAKATIDADIYAKFTAPLIIQAINDTYDADMDEQIAKLNSGGLTTDVAVALANIKTIHDECSLDRATSYLTAQNKAAQKSPPAPPPLIAQAAPAAKGDATIANRLELVRPTALPAQK